MRNAFAAELTRLAAADPRIVLLSGDIGNRLFDRFKEQAPGRFFNCGVAESHMIGLAAGMAACGMRPFCYTIASFATYRVIEQIRLDLAYHGMPVVVIGTGGGFSYASLGTSHHTPEELGMLRLIPGLQVVAPADVHELRAALAHAMACGDSPTYIRIGKKGEPEIHAGTPAIAPGQGIVLRPPGEVNLLATGTILAEAIAAADRLAEAGIRCGVASLPSLKPFDTALLEESFAHARLVVTVEEHSAMGGLGTAVAEWLAGRRHRPQAALLRLGSPDTFAPGLANQASARRWAGISAECIARAVCDHPASSSSHGLR